MCCVGCGRLSAVTTVAVAVSAGVPSSAISDGLEAPFMQPSTAGTHCAATLHYTTLHYTTTPHFLCPLCRQEHTGTVRTVRSTVPRDSSA
jgi:hypothetical protein